MEKNMEQKRLTLSEYDAIVAFDRLCFPEDHWTEEDWRELLADERAVVIHRDQHFMSANIGLSCATAPIRDHLGRVTAALDVSTTVPILVAGELVAG